MIDRSQYQKVESDHISLLKFRTITPSQARAIKERIRNISRGGIAIQTSTPLSLDTIVEVTYQPDLGGRSIEAVGIVRWVDPELPGGGIQFIRVTSPEGTSRQTSRVNRQPTGSPFDAAVTMPSTGTPASTTVFSDGPTLMVTGEFGPAAYNSFVSTWAQTLSSDSDRLIIDLTQVARIASMGVGLLVGAHMDALKLGKSVTIKAPIIFQRLFAVAGVDRVLRFVYIDSLEEETGSPTVFEEEATNAVLTKDGTDLVTLDDNFFDMPDPVAEAEAELEKELGNMPEE